MARPRRSVGQVERKVYFYRAHAGQDEDGRPRRLELRRALEHVNRLSFASGERYLEAPDGNATCCWIDAPNKVRIANVRRSGLPHVEQAGRLQPLRIPAASGLVEETPVMLLPRNIVGVVFNFYGPRIPRLSTYLAIKAAGICPPVTFEALLRPDVLEQLKRLRDLRLFQLKVRASWATALAEADMDLSRTFEAAARAGGAEEIEVILRPMAYSRGTLAGKLLAATRRVVGLDRLHEEASRFVVRGLDRDTGKVEMLDPKAMG